MRNNDDFEEFRKELAEEERKDYEDELDMIDELGEFEDEDEEYEEGRFVLVELVEDAEGFGFVVDPDEPYGEDFMRILVKAEEVAAGRTLNQLLKCCEERERGVLANEIRQFLNSYKSVTFH